MGRWGDGEMGRWGDGEMGRFLLSDAARSWGNPRVKALHRSPAPWEPPREGAASLLPTPENPKGVSPSPH
ncbi:hypothetical protein [Moorena sp. SIO3H5]|uniref:hypothetical protein n=1 Tax=Moorena sp. SIO3H5 TaxID=2607834 RepID=UPI0013BE39EB|nr:hypothetical protein [Moorena sp. SIO3H5]NEO70891.1 hypothetical protein [Moorena sp. SIO3H5]